MEQLPKIVQQRLQKTARLGDHPDPDLLNAFIEKSLNDRERLQVLQHLADCPDCRGVIALAMPETKSAPSPGSERSRWLSWPVLRWGALAACVVVVSAAVMLRSQHRRAVGTFVAEKAPAAPPNFNAGNKMESQPREKLAANMPPPAPFQSDGNLGVASKLARQRDKTMDSGTAAARTAVAQSQGPGRVESDRELANDRVGKDQVADAGAMKSADKPASSAVAGLSAGSSAGMAMPMAPPAEVRNGRLDDSPRSVTENVTVEGATTSASETSSTSEPKAKDELSKKESQKDVLAGAAGGIAPGDRKADTLSAAVTETAPGSYATRSRGSGFAPRWAISADGLLQRSLDSGKTWQTIPVARNIVFRALAANDSEIWVGGASGALYHSSDAGQHWVQIRPVDDGKSLTADIVTVEFGDRQHGTLTTGNREIWTTTDAGRTWQKH